jgi:hypothetical protein
VFLDDVKVVQQPFARGTDIHIAIRGFRQSGVRVIEDATGLDEPGQEPGPALRPPPLHHLLRRRNRLGSLGEVLGAQQFTANRPGEQLVGNAGAARAEAGEKGR